MGILFVYILKSSVCLAMFYLFYRLLLSRETFHRFNRIALLGILSLSCILPLVQISMKQQTEVHQTMMTLEQWLLLANAMATTTTAQMQNVTVTWIQMALLAYLAGILFFAFRNLYSLSRLLLLLKTGRKEVMNKYSVKAGKTILVVHNREIAPFSWMKYVVISQKDLEENGREILIHELAHIRNRHSLDLLVADICIFFQWFNPASWLLKQELQNIHEYEADETVIKEGVDAKQYQLLLIKKAVGTRLYSMANSFNHSKLKKRITMMLKEKSSPWACLKCLYVLPVAAIAVTAFARPEVSSTVEEISAVKVNDLAAIVETKVAESISVVESKEVVVPKDTVKYTPVEVEGMANDVVEQLPEYPGGIKACMEYLQKNMRYPEAAKNAGIQGRVIVQFVVKADGKVTEPKVIRPVDKALDAEAIRLIKSLPNWKPGMDKGKAVATKFTLPVTFNLDGSVVNIRRNTADFPLCIINDKEVGQDILEALSPDKIEKIVVLKDKAALDVYGEKGKNGVLLITLKKGVAPVGEEIQVVGTNRPIELPGLMGVYVGNKKANMLDVTLYVDGKKIDTEGKELEELVPAESIGSIDVTKSPDGKGEIRIITKKGTENAADQGSTKVKGSVVDVDGKPVVGASVIIAGTNIGTISNADGNFMLPVKKGDILVISYIGMSTVKLETTSFGKVASSMLKVTLKDE